MAFNDASELRLFVKPVAFGSATHTKKEKQKISKVSAPVNSVDKSQCLGCFGEVE